jgi:hypothetical protein
MFEQRKQRTENKKPARNKRTNRNNTQPMRTTDGECFHLEKNIQVRAIVLFSLRTRNKQQEEARTARQKKEEEEQNAPTQEVLAFYSG